MCNIVSEKRNTHVFILIGTKYFIKTVFLYSVYYFQVFLLLNLFLFLVKLFKEELKNPQLPVVSLVFLPFIRSDMLKKIVKEFC